jgi:general secretion pathway protein M
MMFEFLARYSQREKLIVAAALLVMIIIGGDALVIEPYFQRESALQEEIAQQRADLEWMRSAVARIPSTAMTANTAQIKGTLVNFIDQAVRRQGLTGQLSQMSPVGTDEIRMRYNAVDFNQLVGFIALVSSSGLAVKDLRISPTEAPGIVDSSLVLERR